MATALPYPGFISAEQITEGDWHLLYRGYENEHTAAVLLKIPHRSAQPHADLRLLQYEHALLSELSIPGLLRPHGLLQQGSSSCLVLDDRGGVPLDTVPMKPLAFFFKVALQLCEILGQLHRCKIIHRNINPRWILVNESSGEISLADLSAAVRFTGRTTEALPCPLSSRSLRYVSPELTGRVNRSIDYRTDLYSLGIVLYEMLTGAVPFLSDDPLEIVHGHIAGTLRPPSDVDPSIPTPLSEIIAKLLAKTAEERYQSALGAKKDLQQCECEWRRGRSIATFPLGLHDVSEHFLIPERLYGRDRELAVMLKAFEQACNGGAALMLVSGYAGIGKTSLIQELYKPILRERGYFTSGKFDQVVRTIPFGAFIQAFRGLVRQLLTEHEDRIAYWKERLSQALGSNCGVLAEVVPEIVLLMGPQSPPAHLDSTESRNRFQLVVQNLLEALARTQHPLVIFLDDLQWADQATLSLLQPVLMSPGIGQFLLIGAYRDNEMDPGHPLARVLTGLEQAGAVLHRIQLGPLALPDLIRLIGDTLHLEGGEVESLARLVQEKTDGNPFFVKQFLQTLRQDELLTFDSERSCWTFRMQDIVGAGITDNVIDLMTRKIQRLAPATQRALTLAACIGNPFKLDTLATVSRMSPETAAADLREAIEEGLVHPTSGTGRAHAFLHDRVQQAAYAIIPDEKKRSVHLAAGRLLRDQAEIDGSDDSLFDIAHHLNMGGALITDPLERISLARLNLAAGRKAKAATAYQAALEHHNAGLMLLDTNNWNSDYDLKFSLHMEAAECEYLCGNFDRADHYFALLLGEAKTLLEKAQVHSLRIVQYENMSRYGDAIVSGRQALASFGIAFPDSEAGKQEALDDEIKTIKELLGLRSIESLADLPPMQDPETRMVMRILTALWAPAYLNGDQAFTRLISATMVRLSLSHGNSEESAYGYVTHAITVGPVRGDYRAAYDFGRLALQVNEALNDSRRRAKVHQQFNAHVNLWRKPLPTCIPHAREACRSGLETGDFTYANYGVFTESWAAFFACRDFRLFVQDYSPNLELIRKLRMDSFVDGQKLILNWARALQGQTQSRLELSTENFDENEYARNYAANPLFMGFFHIAKLHLFFNFAEFRRALEAEQAARQVIHALGGTIWPVQLGFWGGLTMAALYEDSAEPDRRFYMDEMLKSKNSLELLAANCPENFRCQHLLLAAELERIQHHDPEAVCWFEQALSYAHSEHDLQYEALANELYARFWLSRKCDRIASIFLMEAIHRYHEMNATAKARNIEESFRHLVPFEDVHTSRAWGSELVERSGSESVILDISTAMKAVRAIAVSIELDDLLKRLMRIALENAGAQRGFLLQEKDGRLLIEAEGEVNREAVVLQHHPLEFCGISQAIVRYVRNTGEDVIVGNAPTDERFAADPYIVKACPKSILCVPIQHQGSLNGILYLENNLTANAFTSERIEIMRILSGQAAISLENARLYEELKREAKRRQHAEERNRTLLRINNAIITNLTHEALFHSICEALRPVVPFDRSALILHDPKNNMLRVLALEGQFRAETFRVGALINRHDSHAGWVFDHEKPLLRRDLASESDFTPEHLVYAEGIRSVCTVPLIVRGATTGTLSVLSETANQYSQVDMEFLQEVATQVALAVGNMQAYEEISALKARLEAENVYLQEEIRQEHNFEEIVGNSPLLMNLLRQVEKVAPTESTVLIYGETGTGKELIARAIHNRSLRKDRPLVKVNCGAISAGLVESELFGHVKGAFTGAVENRVGRFELANGGTLFLDEVGELPLDTQVKLLRVLQEREFEPVGSSRTVTADVRIIAASNRDLAAAVDEGRFRADLFYRLNVFPVTLAPLRARRSDIAQLVTFFLSRYSREIGKTIQTISQSSMDQLINYPWPGNVRELQNVLQRAVVLSSGPILTLEPGLLPGSSANPEDHKSRHLGNPASDFGFADRSADAMPTSLFEIDRRHILSVLEQCSWIVDGPSGAAILLHIHPNTLRSRMKKLGIRRPLPQ